jgi:hypothetical protein
MQKFEKYLFLAIVSNLVLLWGNANSTLNIITMNGINSLIIKF